MISLFPFPIPPLASLDDGYFPITGPNGPLIFLYSMYEYICSAATTERERNKQLGLFWVCVKEREYVQGKGESVGDSGGESSKRECERDKSPTVVLGISFLSNVYIIFFPGIYIIHYNKSSFGASVWTKILVFEHLYAYNLQYVRKDKEYIIQFIVC